MVPKQEELGFVTVAEISQKPTPDKTIMMRQVLGHVRVQTGELYGRVWG